MNKEKQNENNSEVKKPAKRVALIITILIIALIPAILGVASYIIKTNNFFGVDTIKVSLYYDNVLLGEASDKPSDPDSDELVLVFDSVIKNMQKASSAPNDLSKRSSYKVVIASRNEANEYKCYFDLKGDSYCVDAAQEIYIISNESAKRFFSSVYAEALYDNAFSPKMYSSSDEEILPIAHEWSYKNINDEYLIASEIEEIDDLPEYNMSGSLGLDFDIMPDDCFVEVYKSGIVIYEGGIDGLSAVAVESGTTLQFEVNATWDRKEDRDFYGTVDYSFKAIVRDRAEFILDKYTVNTGDFVITTCVNVWDAAKVDLRTFPEINCTPVFFDDNGVVRTLIPFSQDLKSGEYDLIFSYGAVEETVKVTVNKSDNKEYVIKPENSSVMTNLTNKNNLKELQTIISSLNYEPNVYQRSEYLDYRALGATVLAKYGSVITTTNNNVRYIAEGTQFVWENDKNAVVPVLNNGVVVDAGFCNYLGNYVIVDHGMGLRTVYSHLDKIFINEGDILVKGEIIGLCGSLNIVSPSGVFVMCYVYDVAVDFDNIAGKSLHFYYPIIEEDE